MSDATATVPPPHPGIGSVTSIGGDRRAALRWRDLDKGVRITRSFARTNPPVPSIRPMRDS